MTQITLDATVSSQLNDVTQVVELCDQNGRVLGRFVPSPDLANWEPVSPAVGDEELARRASSPGKRFTTEEVLRHLEQL